MDFVEIGLIVSIAVLSLSTIWGALTAWREFHMSADALADKLREPRVEADRRARQDERAITSA